MKQNPEADSQLKDKAIDIKGKKYVLVSDRVRYFNEKYERGMVTTEIVGNAQDKMVVVKAIVTPDYLHPTRYFSAFSQAVWGTGLVNRTAALENAETSAVGRALALMGIGVIDSIASVDEINKAENDVRNQDIDENDVMDRAMNNSKCPKCGAPMKKSSKGNWYCSNMCWKNKINPQNMWGASGPSNYDEHIAQVENDDPIMEATKHETE